MPGSPVGCRARCAWVPSYPPGPTARAGITASRRLVRWRLDPAQDCGDLAEDGRLRAVDGLEGRVVRQQPHLPTLALERLDGGLVVQQGGHDVAVVGRRLL